MTENKRLSHLDESGRARMVDVGGKDVTERIAVTKGVIRMRSETLAQIHGGGFEKGDVLGVARVAAVMAAKKTHDLIPLCHQIPLSQVTVEFRDLPNRDGIEIQGTARATWKTGVEMEALTAVSVAALTIYDMCKAVDRSMTIGEIRLVEKSGGRSGDFKSD